METNNVNANNTAVEIKMVCNDICEMLIRKNNSYGDSALTPLRVFSRADPSEQLNVRLDDKLTRIANGNGDDFNEEVELDIVGYLILKEIKRRRSRLEKARAEADQRRLQPQPSEEQPAEARMETSLLDKKSLVGQPVPIEEDADEEKAILQARKVRRGLSPTGGDIMKAKA